MVKVSTEDLRNRQKELIIEADPAEMEESAKKAYLRLAQTVNVPGFRKGKIPRQVLELHIGKRRIEQEATEILLSELHQKVLQEQNIKILGEPALDIIQHSPLKFKIILSLPPLVELGEYRGIRLPLEKKEVSAEEVQNFIEWGREQLAPWQPVERPVGFGDMVVADVENKSGYELQVDGQDAVYYISPGSPQVLPGFIEKMIGMRSGEEKELQLSYSVDYEDKTLAGKDFLLKVKIKEIKEKHLHELNDEFARSVGKGVETLDALRAKVAVELQAAADTAARAILEEKALAAVAGLSRVEFPPALVKWELDRLLEGRAQAFGGGAEGLKSYLKQVNKTEESLCEELRPQVETRLTKSLILDELAEAEGIKVNDTEIETEIENIVRTSGEEAEEIRKRSSVPEARLSVEHWLLQRKALQRLVEIVTTTNSEESKVAEQGKKDKVETLETTPKVNS